MICDVDKFWPIIFAQKAPTIEITQDRIFEEPLYKDFIKRKTLNLNWINMFKEWNISFKSRTKTVIYNQTPLYRHFFLPLHKSIINAFVHIWKWCIKLWIRVIPTNLNLSLTSNFKDEIISFCGASIYFSLHVNIWAFELHPIWLTNLNISVTSCYETVEVEGHKWWRYKHEMIQSPN